MQLLATHVEEGHWMTWKDVHDPLLNKQDVNIKTVSGWSHVALTNMYISKDKLTNIQKAIHRKDNRSLLLVGKIMGGVYFLLLITYVF